VVALDKLKNVDPKCWDILVPDIPGPGIEVSRDTGPGSEMSWDTSDLGPKCPMLFQAVHNFVGHFGLH